MINNISFPLIFLTVKKLHHSVAADDILESLTPLQSAKPVYISCTLTGSPHDPVSLRLRCPRRTPPHH